MMSDTRIDSPFALTTAQRSVLDHLIRTPHPTRVLVEAPLGTGKTTAASQALQETFRRDSRARVLVVVSHSILSRQYRLRVPAPWIDLSTKAAWREAEALGRVQRPGPLLATVSATALAEARVGSALAESRWNLVVVDDADAVI